MERTSSPAVLQLPSEVTHESLDGIDGEVRRLLGPDGAVLLVDLGATEFLSSGGLGLLVRWGKTLSERGGAIALVRPRGAVQRLLRSVGLDAILPWFSSADAATAHVLARGATR